jgi:hypothetical protein
VTFLIFMYVSAFVLLIAYARRLKLIRIEISRWMFVFEAGKFMIYTRWLNDTTVDSFKELQRKEGHIG